MFAEAIKPNLSPVPDQTFMLFKDLVTRRTQLVYMLFQEKNRLSYAAGPMFKSINKHISWLEREIEQLDNNIDNSIKSSSIYHEKVIIIRSMPGCGSR
jgi:transposase